MLHPLLLYLERQVAHPGRRSTSRSSGSRLPCAHNCTCSRERLSITDPLLTSKRALYWSITNCPSPNTAHGGREPSSQPAAVHCSVPARVGGRGRARHAGRAGGRRGSSCKWGVNGVTSTSLLAEFLYIFRLLAAWPGWRGRPAASCVCVRLLAGCTNPCDLLAACL